jgi:hypothetical protein
MAKSIDERTSKQTYPVKTPIAPMFISTNTITSIVLVDATINITIGIILVSSEATITELNNLAIVDDPISNSVKMSKVLSRVT